MSVDAHDYIPPLAFEPFAVSVTQPELAAALPVPTPPGASARRGTSDGPHAHRNGLGPWHASTRIPLHGPRLSRRQLLQRGLALGLAAQQAPIPSSPPVRGASLPTPNTDSRDDPAPQSSTRQHAYVDNEPYSPVPVTPPSYIADGVSRSTSDAVPNSLPRKISEDDRGTLHRRRRRATTGGDGEQRGGGLSTDGQGMGSADRGRGLEAKAHSISRPSTSALDRRSDHKQDLPRAVLVNSILASSKEQAAATDVAGKHVDAANPRYSILDSASILSSRPASALSEEMIDQLETLAEGLRALSVGSNGPPDSPAPTQTVYTPVRPLVRVSSPKHGPRACSPQLQPAMQRAGNPRVEKEPVSQAQAQAPACGPVEGADMEGRSEMETTQMDESVSYCSSAKGKCKTASIEMEHVEEQVPEGTMQPVEDHPAEPNLDDLEPLHIYDPHNAPEFLVGTSTSLLVQATPGYHSIVRPRAHPAHRRRNGPRRRPGALVLALGSQLDHHGSDDGHESTPADSTPHTGDSRSRSRSRSHSRSRQPQAPRPQDLDLKALELLVGPMESRSKPKPKAKEKPKLRVAPVQVAAIGRSPKLSPLERADKPLVTRYPTRPLLSPASPPATNGPMLGRNPVRRHAVFASFVRWFRRWTR
ncbi:uncharacterized protein LAESUDRAFT_756351 [Laetiporus sulphureus 93-53]|uniref:Uncharacterized protein n=1 Tax=Laetiporus sulphureus 93-53 TaxID=1314785 RepID=A0A165GCK7_9APHY|nr:uncharacterized protein LAESUDRAFT_756351 [Laetiporus sulphureus 93-53]KZT10161.1 hypothetical protein LAESUDRAFT_756351 [Laetiporus sulphureus 93-53]